MRRSIVIGLLAAILIPAAVSAQNCEPGSVAVQILGSGGPRINPFRSSTSYLLWVGDQARVLVDMGGGALGRFGQAQAKVSDLSLLAVSHLHPDHISDLPAFLWLSHEIRKEPLRIVGPSGNDAAPDFATFLARLFDEKNGAFPVLGATLGGMRRDMRSGPPSAGGSVPLDVGVIDVTKAEPSTVFDRDGLTVTALGIPHGNMPTLAYRVKVRNMSIVFSSDQTGTDPKFVDFAKGANILIMHLAHGAGVRNNPLHAGPDVVGRVAQEAKVGRLIVSHIGIFDLDAALADLKKSYSGPLTIGADLQCTPVK
ncbi:MAG TPA: MBL fold metallo-hydrolase [Burkholderiales bacterium]|nr:MBL fold metallo-hydrolase [Burkholderiales bacterium]